MEMAKMEFKSPSPGWQLALRWDLSFFHSSLLMELLKYASSMSLSKLENRHCLPFASHLGSEEPAFDKGPPLPPLPGRATSVPATPPSFACGLEPLQLLPLPPASPISLVPLLCLQPPPPPLMRIRRRERWELERVIPFLFIGLHQRTRGKECGLYPEARSKALIGARVLAGLGLWPLVP